jgi:hypothetical protein
MREYSQIPAVVVPYTLSMIAFALTSTTARSCAAVSRQAPLQCRYQVTLVYTACSAHTETSMSYLIRVKHVDLAVAAALGRTGSIFS